MNEEKEKFKKNTKKFIIGMLVSAFAVVFILWFLQGLLMPKYASDVVEGALVKEYYKEDNKDFDVLFVGDCEVYENFSPAKLWEEYGINSYIRGSAEQYIWQSYYFVEETLNYHKPDVVVFNIQSLQFNESDSEAYNRMTLDDMKWSKSKVGSIKASMKEDETFISYLFPILRYHSRWNELTADDFKYFFDSPQISYNGYYMRVDSLAAENVPEGRRLLDYSFGDKAWSYLDKMKDLCESEGIKLVLIKAPSLFPTWYDEWDEQVKEYAEKNDLTYINFLEVRDEIGLDYSTDTYDAGLHLNLLGAEKMSKYFGKYLSEELGVADRRDERELSDIWDEKIEAYENEVKAQCEKYNVDYNELTGKRNEI